MSTKPHCCSLRSERKPFNVPRSSRSPFVVSGGRAHEFFRPGMLRIWSVSGDCLASYPAEEAGDVRTLKRKLQSWCGVPRFRQRLLNNDVDLGDDAPLHSAMDLQLILLPFAEEHVDDLATAVENNLVSKVEEVLRRAQNPDLSRQDAVETPLGIAAQRGHVEISRLLLEACADKDKICRGVRKTPLGLACCGGHVDIVRLLLEARADKDNTDGQGITTAIQLASSRGQVEIVRLLLEANTNTKEFKPVSGQGRTALARASRRGHTEIVRLLLQARAIKKAEDHDCHTALKLASRRGHWEIVRVLQEASATQDRQTQTTQVGFRTLHRRSLQRGVIGLAGDFSGSMDKPPKPKPRSAPLLSIQGLFWLFQGRLNTARKETQRFTAGLYETAVLAGVLVLDVSGSDAGAHHIRCPMPCRGFARRRRGSGAAFAAGQR